MREEQIEQGVGRVRVRSSAELDARVLKRAEAAMREPVQWRRPGNLWRIIMPASIAASIIGIGSLLYVMLCGPTANAAETLKEVAAANQAYKGWIHAKAERIVPPEHDGRRFIGASYHINMGKQVYINVIDYEGGRNIEWIDLKDRTYQQYTSENNLVTLTELPSAIPIERIHEEIKTRRDIRPLELIGLLVMQPTMDSVTAMMDYGCSVSQRGEGVYDRFDLAMPGRQGAADGKENKPFLSLLFDKQTKLLQRLSTTATPDGTEAVISYTYGEPSIQNIHDVGAPLEAQVLDQRPRAAATTSRPKRTTMTSTAATRPHRPDAVRVVFGEDSAITFDGQTIKMEELAGRLDRIPNPANVTVEIATSPEPLTDQQYQEMCQSVLTAAREAGFQRVVDIGIAGTMSWGWQDFYTYPKRPGHFVRLLLCDGNQLNFQGVTCTLQQLPRLLQKVPGRAETLMEIGVRDDGVRLKEIVGATKSVFSAARQHGFQNVSYIGTALLGSTAAEPTAVPRPGPVSGERTAPRQR